MELIVSIVAIWGGILSTVLALLQIVDQIRWRSKIDIEFFEEFGDDDRCNLILRNLSDRPIIITYWELYFSKRKIDDKEWKHNMVIPEDLRSTLTIAPFDSETIIIKNEYKSFFGKKSFFSEKIQITLCIAGRNPKTYKIR